MNEKRESKKNIIADTLGIRRPDELLPKKDLPMTIEHEEDKKPQSTELSTMNSSDEMIRDIDTAKDNVQNIITYGDSALADMMELAKQSESPRAYEVAASLMKTLLDANKDFVVMSNRKHTAKEEAKTGGSGGNEGPNVVNNNLVVSTTDLLKMLKGEGEK